MAAWSSEPAIFTQNLDLHSVFHASKLRVCREWKVSAPAMRIKADLVRRRQAEAGRVHQGLGKCDKRLPARPPGAEFRGLILRGALDPGRCAKENSAWAGGSRARRRIACVNLALPSPKPLSERANVLKRVPAPRIGVAHFISRVSTFVTCTLTRMRKRDETRQSLTWLSLKPRTNEIVISCVS